MRFDYENKEYWLRRDNCLIIRCILSNISKEEYLKPIDDERLRNKVSSQWDNIKRNLI